jgi:hypothetical protein
MYYKVNRLLTDVETLANIADAIPVVGIFSSAVRIGAGKVQLAVGACITFVGLLDCLCGNNRRHVVQLGCDQVLHGFLNIIRGIGTFLLAGTGLNFVLAAQVFKKDHFAPVIQYGKIYGQPVYARN